jgi:TetR/AcrR family transcriptional repressor of mexJK operon
MELQFSRPKEALRRAAILGVARAVFSEEGYAATSMSSIAARLGGSKATLYKYFRSKEELFAASLENLIAIHADDLSPKLATGESLETSLTALCVTLTTAMLSLPILSLFRLVVAESSRFPELGQAYYQKVVLTGHRQIAGFLQHCIDQRLIKPVDPMMAAAQLAGLCRSTLHFKALANVDRVPGPAEIEAEAHAAAATFLAAYRADRG